MAALRESSVVPGLGTGGTGEPGGGGGSLGTMLCVLTGASRGFGRSLAWELCPRVLPGSVLLLVSRTEEAMRELAGELELRYPGVAVRWVAADLGTEAGLSRAVREAQELRGVERAERLLIINNAGSLGDISKAFVGLSDPQEVDRYLSFNVTSALCLTSALLQMFRGRAGLRRVVVNVSSLAAIKPFRSWTLYCAGKAARDMMFRVLAEEEADVRVLSYAPGPMDTDMQTQARTLTADPELRLLFLHKKNSGSLVDSRVSSRKLLDILQSDTFTSGAHIDYYD